MRLKLPHCRTSVNSIVLVVLSLPGLQGSALDQSNAAAARQSQSSKEHPDTVKIRDARVMKVGIIGTGAIASLHAAAYANIGFRVTVCTDIDSARGSQFAGRHGARFVGTAREVCESRDVDYVDICTLPNVRLEPVRLAIEAGRHVQVQKPIATTLAVAGQMVDMAERHGVLLGVVSQHRFDDSTRTIAAELRSGRMGQLLEGDAYVKWYRTPDYYAKPGKGTFAVEGGGALVNQGIHQVDLLRWLGGPVRRVTGAWRLGALHRIEAEDILNALLEFESGAVGVIQCSTAFWPGVPERLELHGTKGMGVITGDRLTALHIQGQASPVFDVPAAPASGASDPLAISTLPFERQFISFAEAIAHHRPTAVSGVDGYDALAIVDAIYRSCSEHRPVRVSTV